MRVASLAALTIAALAGFSMAQEMPKCAVSLERPPFIENENRNERKEPRTDKACFYRPIA